MTTLTRRFLPPAVILAAVLMLTFTGAPAAHADRTQVYSVVGADCAECGGEAQAVLKKLKGVRRSSFDRDKVELTVVLADGVTDAQVVAAIRAAKKEFTLEVGPGKGAYLPPEKWPEGADVQILTRDGSAIGPLEKLRVPGKTTVFDVYADWCGPCRVVDGRLREAAATRSDLAVRKLNVVRFDTPLAKELGPRLTALPYVIVFSPSGRRTEIVGDQPAKLAAALATK